MSERLDAIKARAEAAAEGPWEEYDSNEGTGHRPMWEVANDAFHNPPTDEDAPWIAVEIHTGRKTDAEFIAHARADVPALVAAVEAVSLHVPFADTAGNVYCSVRGADYYTDCPTFKSGDTWPDHIANVVARALGEES